MGSKAYGFGLILRGEEGGLERYEGFIPLLRRAFEMQIVDLDFVSRFKVHDVAAVEIRRAEFSRRNQDAKQEGSSCVRPFGP